MVTSLSELKTALSALNIPIAYSHFKSAVQTPYLVFYVESQDNFFADNTVYEKIKVVNIELYTDKKDETLENSLETILNNNELPYNVTSEIFIEEEGLYEVIYEIEL